MLWGQFSVWIETLHNLEVRALGVAESRKGKHLRNEVDVFRKSTTLWLQVLGLLADDAYKWLFFIFNHIGILGLEVLDITYLTAFFRIVESVLRSHFKL